jgi:hypothetical protein
MHKFYYKFQWVGVIIAPALVLFGPSLFGIITEWEDVILPAILGVSIFGLLLAIAIVTTTTGRQTGIKAIGTRVATLLEGSYTAIFAILLTLGSPNPGSIPPIVSVLHDRKISYPEAWFINDGIKTILFFVIFLFLVTALISAIVQQVKIKHHTVEVIPRLDIEE